MAGWSVAHRGESWPALPPNRHCAETIMVLRGTKVWSTLRPKPPGSSGSALWAVELATSGNLCSCPTWPDALSALPPALQLYLLSFLLIQPARLSPPLFSPPLSLESSPGFPAASSFCCLLGSLPSSAPASPVPAVCSAPRLSPSPATRGSTRPVRPLQSGSLCLPTRVRVPAAGEEAAAAGPGSPLPPRQPEVGGERAAGQPLEPLRGQCTRRWATLARSRPRPPPFRRPPPPPGYSPSSSGGAPPAAGEAQATAVPAPVPAAGGAAADAAGAAAPRAAAQARSERTTTRALASASHWCLPPPRSRGPRLRGAS